MQTKDIDSVLVSNQLISLTSRELADVTPGYVPSNKPVSNQLISLTSREEIGIVVMLVVPTLSVFPIN